MYRIQDFARKAGVTVRALHHYDRVGLLEPRRTRAGYRVYRDSDLPQLHRILVLKFLGLSLTEIAEALKSESHLNELLKTRRYAVKRKRERLAAALCMFDELQNTPAEQRDWADFASFARDLGSHSEPEGSWKRRQLDEAWRMIAERRAAWDATLQDYELNRDIKAAIERGETPDTPAGKALVARWRDAIERFAGGDPELRDALMLVGKERLNQPVPASMAGVHEYFICALQQAS